MTGLVRPAVPWWQITISIEIATNQQLAFFTRVFCLLSSINL
jgi:hypothetical protein